MDEKIIRPYGSDPEMDARVDSDDIGKRIYAAEQGYGTDKLVSDPHVSVRVAVADSDFSKHGILAKDDDPIVRAEVAKKTNDEALLDILVSDIMSSVRINVAERGIEKYLAVLVDDPDSDVRLYVAYQRYGLDILKDDPSPDVKATAETEIWDIAEEKAVVDRGRALVQKEIDAHPDGYRAYFGRDEYIDSETFKEIYDEYVDWCDKHPDDNTPLSLFIEEDIFDRWNLAEMLDDDYDYFYNGLSDTDQEAVDAYIKSEGFSSLCEAFQGTSCEHLELDLNDIISDIKVNLMFGTPNERNFNMGSVYDMFRGYNKETKDDFETFHDFASGIALETPNEIVERFDTAVTYLIKQQGHTVSEVAQDFYSYCNSETNEHISESPFVKNLSVEIADFDYSLQELTALVKIDSVAELAVLDKIVHKTGDITISKDSVIGLFNEWDGAASNLQIELEKPLTIPADMVRNVHIEKPRGNMYKYEYPVNYVCDLVGSCWDGKATVAKPNEKSIALTRDDYMEIAESIKALSEKTAVKEQSDKADER